MDITYFEEKPFYTKSDILMESPIEYQVWNPYHEIQILTYLMSPIPTYLVTEYLESDTQTYSPTQGPYPDKIQTLKKDLFV